VGQLAGLLVPAAGLGHAPILTTAEARVWPLAQDEGHTQGVDPGLIMAVVAQESQFNPMATRVEPDGRVSYGLMQLLADTARLVASDLPGLRVADLYDPALNVKLGTRYLARQLGRYGGDAATAVAAYNAGTAYQDAAGRFVSQRGDPGVQTHVNRVLAYLARYRGLPGAALAALGGSRRGRG